MVQFGGSVNESSHGRMRDVRTDRRSEEIFSHQTALAYFGAATVAVAMAVVALALVVDSSGIHQDIVLSEKGLHDLHLANSLKDALTKGPDPSVPASDNSESDIHLGAKDAAMINLDEARKQAEKRVRMIAARHKLDTTHDEELILKQKLDADTR